MSMHNSAMGGGMDSLGMGMNSMGNVGADTVGAFNALDSIMNRGDQSIGSMGVNGTMEMGVGVQSVGMQSNNAGMQSMGAVGVQSQKPSPQQQVQQQPSTQGRTSNPNARKGSRRMNLGLNADIQAGIEANQRAQQQQQQQAQQRQQQQAQQQAAAEDANFDDADVLNGIVAQQSPPMNPNYELPPDPYDDMGRQTGGYTEQSQTQNQQMNQMNNGINDGADSMFGAPSSVRGVAGDRSVAGDGGFGVGGTLDGLSNSNSKESQQSRAE